VLVLLLVLDPSIVDHEHEQEHDYEEAKKNEQKQRPKRLTTYELFI